MKRSKKPLTFVAIAASIGALSLAVEACVYGPPNEPVETNVYGPPPETSDKPVTQQTESKETKQTDASLPSEYDPTLEPEVDVYGPPPDSPD